jgi:hypothetical protein
MNAQEESQQKPTTKPPQVGDRYHCELCGMELEITKDCQRTPRLECCGQPLSKLA